jgi:predicted CopG family antitoxin
MKQTRTRTHKHTQKDQTSIHKKRCSGNFSTAIRGFFTKKKKKTDESMAATQSREEEARLEKKKETKKYRSTKKPKKLRGDRAVHRKRENIASIARACP